MTHDVQISCHHTFIVFYRLRGKYSKFIDGSLLNGFCDFRDILRIKGNHGATGLLQCPADLSGKAIFQHDLILQPLLDLIHQDLRLLVLPELTVFDHILIGMFPCQVRRNKEAHELFVRHMFMPVLNKAFLEFRQVFARTKLSAVFLNRSPQAETPGPGIKESRLMGSILHAV